MVSCWGITSGAAGMQSQVRALAGAMEVDAEMKKAQLRKPFVYLPNMVFAGPLSSCVLPLVEGDAISPPWPEVVIGCGRRGAVVALGMKARAKNTKFIQIGDPYVNPAHFDAVVAMQHDMISGGNVVKTRFALHSITLEKLVAARVEFAGRFAQYGSPRVAVLLGGSTNKYTLTKNAMQKVIDSLVAFQKATGASLLITPSRRTGVENISMLRAAFAENSQVYIYDFVEANPYIGLLALADATIVTDDSVNMMSEAHATGKPLYVLPLEGHLDTKPARFAEGLLRDGIARGLGTSLEAWAYPASNEMAKLKDRISMLLV